MKEKIINNILQRMQDKVNNKQLEELKIILIDEFSTICSQCSIISFLISLSIKIQYSLVCSMAYTAAVAGRDIFTAKYEPNIILKNE